MLTVKLGQNVSSLFFFFFFLLSLLSAAPKMDNGSADKVCDREHY